MNKILVIILLLSPVFLSVNAQVKVDKNIARQYYKTLKQVPPNSDTYKGKGESSSCLFTIIRADTLNKADTIERKVNVMDIDSAGNTSPMKTIDENVLPYPGKFSLRSLLYKGHLILYPGLVFYRLKSDILGRKIITSLREDFGTKYTSNFILTKSSCIISTKNIRPNKTIYGSITILTKPNNVHSPFFKNGVIRERYILKYFFKTQPPLFKKIPKTLFP